MIKLIQRPEQVSATAIAALLLWLGLTLLSGICQAQTQASERKSILVLNSYHWGAEWAEGEVKGLLTEFRASELDLELFIEQMDVLRQPRPFDDRGILKHLRQRYAPEQFDLIVVTDDTALEFVARHYREMFPGIPVVFSDASELALRHLPPEMPVTGVMEHRAFLRTIELARRLRPDATQIVVFGNEYDNHTGPRTAQRILSEAALGLPVRVHNDLTLEQIRDVGANLDPRDIVVCLALAVDDTGRRYTFEEVKKVLSTVSPAPLFEFWSLGIHSGYSLGGEVNSPEWQGQAAARLALRILEGEDPRQIPIIEDAPTQLMINYRVMRRHGIDESALPRGTVFVDKPPSFYGEYRYLIWGTIVVLIALLLIITMLLANIRRRQRAEQALRASEARFRSIFEFAPMGVAVANGDNGMIAAANSAMQSLVGYSEAELCTMSFKDITHPDDLHKDLSQYQELLDGRRGYFAMEKRYLHKDGSIVWAGLTVSAIRDEKGRPIAAVGMVEDITERRRAEEALRTSMTRLHTVITGAPIVLFSFDRQGVFLLSEGKGLESMGLAPGEVVGKSAFEMYADLPEVLDCIRRATQGETFTESVNLAGSTFLAYHTPLYGSTGERDGTIGVLVDITEQARAEEALRRLNEQLEQRVEQRTEELVRSEKLASLGALVAGVSHELSTPLGSGLTVATALADRVQGLSGDVQRGDIDPETLRRFVNFATEASDLLERTLTQSSELVQNFKKMAVDQTSTQRREFDLAETVNDILATLKFQFKHSGCQLQLNVPRGIQMESFPGALGQAMINLVNNAIVHAFPEGACGTVTITAELADPKRLRMSIADNGQGIPKANVSKVFDPFFTTRMGQGGSGLGLHIVYNIVTHVLGGRVEVRSEPDQGTEFVLQLPLTAPEAVTGGAIAGVEGAATESSGSTH